MEIGEAKQYSRIIGEVNELEKKVNKLKSLNSKLVEALGLALNAFKRNDCIDWGIIEETYKLGKKG